LDEGSIILVRNVSLPKASFLKVRAQSVDFLQIKHPRALLEVALRDYTCVTVGDTVKLLHNGKPYFLDVQEVKPNGAASIVETDVEIDFDEPLGYQDSVYAQREKGQSPAIGAEAVPTAPPRELQKGVAVTAAAANAKPSFVAFAGSGRRIDGREAPTSSSSSSSSSNSSSANFSSNSNSANSSSAAYISSSTKSMVSSTPSPVSTASSVDTGSVLSTDSRPSATFQTKIGNKYSTKKGNAAAFQGKGHSLN
jgi:ubiquitin fusion degradation protein 1